MQEPIWHYTDRAGEQRGPATADAVREAVARGEIPRDARLWREGLEDWVHLDAVAAELGVDAPTPVAAAPRPDAAPSRNAAPKQATRSGCLVAVLVAVVVALVLVGIVAVVGVVQYDKYTVRAQVIEGSGAAEGFKYTVAEYHLAHGTLPASNADLDLPEPAALAGPNVRGVEVRSGGEIVATFSSQSPQSADTSLDGATLVYTPTLVEDGTLIWRCDGNGVPPDACPGSCVCVGQ